MERIERRAVSDVALERIKKYIRENGLRPGDGLPSENILSKELGISRPSVREAMKSLEGLGLVESRQGKGRFISSCDYSRALDSLSLSLEIQLSDFYEVLEVRRALERTFLPEVALSYGEKEWRALLGILGKMERARADGADEEEKIALHAAFHKELYKGMGNKLLFSLISVFATMQLSYREKHTGDDSGYVEKHRSLLEAVMLKDRKRILEELDSHYDDWKEVK